MANIDKFSELIVDLVIKSIKNKIKMMIDGILQGYINEDGSHCILEDIINVNSDLREVK